MTQSLKVLHLQKEVHRQKTLWTETSCTRKDHREIAHAMLVEGVRAAVF